MMWKSAFKVFRWFKKIRDFTSLKRAKILFFRPWPVNSLSRDSCDSGLSPSWLSPTTVPPVIPSPIALLWAAFLKLPSDSRFDIFRTDLRILWYRNSKHVLEFFSRLICRSGTKMQHFKCCYIEKIKSQKNISIPKKMLPILKKWIITNSNVTKWLKTTDHFSYLFTRTSVDGT